MNAKYDAAGRDVLPVHTKAEIEVPKHKTPDVLIRAIRQHLHNNGVGFVYAYDMDVVNEEYAKLEQQNAELLAEAKQLFEHRLEWRRSVFGCENSDYQYLVLTKEYPIIAQALAKSRSGLNTLRNYNSSTTILLDLGELGERKAEVDFYYTKAEAESFDSPGCDEDFEIVAVKVCGIDIHALFDKFDGVIEAIKEAR